MPNKSVIKRVVDQFCSHGAILLLRSHPPRVLMPEKLNEIQAKIDAQPSMSVWKLANQSAGLAMITFRMCTKLKLGSYRSTLVNTASIFNNLYNLVRSIKALFFVS